VIRFGLRKEIKRQQQQQDWFLFKLQFLFKRRLNLKNFSILNDEWSWMGSEQKGFYWVHAFDFPISRIRDLPIENSVNGLTLRLNVLICALILQHTWPKTRRSMEISNCLANRTGRTEAATSEGALVARVQEMSQDGEEVLCRICFLSVGWNPQIDPIGPKRLSRQLHIYL